MTRDQIQTVLDALQGYQPYAQVGTQVRQKTDESIAILQAALAEPSEPVAEVAGDYNTKHIIFLPAGIALEVGDKLFTHSASKPAPLPELTDAELMKCFAETYPIDYLEPLEVIQKTQEWEELTALVRAIEAAIRGKT